MSREPIIDTAPGKELIPLIFDGKSASAYTDFYNIRKVWCDGFPLIHDRMVTYGFLDDVWFKQEVKHALFEMATYIALQESDDCFYCALFALNELMPDEQIIQRPLGYGEKLLQLRERCKALIHEPNLACTWNGLLTKSRCLKPVEPDESYDTRIKDLML
ncbi:hypothetical protein A1359_02230 [Methylomonas lenta]|uniref:Uncharacterized protein n=1 Tax=Methylomonas lenta TaxID=980561 RepID=A0A177MUE9_9GAMM|nr:hypothetical protein [Methylomonas lenta]OAI09356.1 hypothetical protein A1359_02230 [Methylomonas lenta]